ncbi:MAG: hypothetical protein ACE37F_26950 [Nannocystaceae bacterium]|nr:hypothetical protein [bacterium]
MPRSLSAMASRRAHAWLAIALLGLGCRNRGTEGPGAEQTQLQAEATIRKAIRQSPEGFIFLPSKRAERVYELPRLNEIAQSMRQPAAACFLGEAVKTMRLAAPGGDEDAPAYEGVPDGQAKLRMRVGADGKVLRVETLETGFEGESVPECIAEELSRRRFPENQTGTAHYIDVVYWVSLGPQPRTDGHAERIRREQVEAGVRAKKCLQGRVGVGAYTIEGLNLVASNGATVANRVEQKGLPDEVRQCVATAFRSLRLLADDSTFIRPVGVRTQFVVADDGVVSVEDEDWLRLVELEERARRDALRAERDAVNPVDTLPPEPLPEPLPEAVPEQAPQADPGEAGLRLDIGPRGGTLR